MERRNPKSEQLGTTLEFQGKETEPISFQELQAAISMVESCKPPVEKILQNCTREQLATVFGKPREGTVRDVIFGMPVYKRKFVPLGELWFVDKEGHILRKFKL